MFRLTLICSLISLSSFALSIDQIVDLTFEKNKNIHALEQSLNITRKGIELSTKLDNPTLSLGINDVQSDVTKRDKEAMQASFIGISQKIPINNRLEIQKSIALNKNQTSQYKIDDLKLQLKSNIYLLSYRIILSKQKLALFDKFEKNLEQLKQYNQSLYEFQSKNQNILLNIEISQANLKLKKYELENLMFKLYSNLEQITYTKIKQIDATLNVKNIKLEDHLNLHPKFLALKQEYLKSINQTKLEEAKKISDLKFNMAYFNRDKKYNDYMNFSVAIPLSIYNKESIKTAQAKFKSNGVSNRLSQLKHDLQTQKDVLQHNIQTSFYKYNIYKKSILPKMFLIQKNIEEYNQSDEVDFDASLKNLNKIIDYELKSINEQEKYFTNLAKSIYITGKYNE